MNVNTEKKKLCVDRVEEGIAVCIARGGEEYKIPSAKFNLHEGDIFTAEISEDKNVLSLTLPPEETENKKISLRQRLMRLFERQE